jgi:TPR repeat protein
MEGHMKTIAFRCLVATILLALLAAPAMGIAGEAGDSRDLALVLNDTTFLAGHPDMRWRKLAIDVHKGGNDKRARELFQRAALYADKFSQAAYAEMLWKGKGGEQDRPLAYAWMDLAAQRGSRSLLARREYFWSQLDEAERARAQDVGHAVYARYGDKVAKPRQERDMRVERNKTTGSRTGAAGTGNICTTLDASASQGGTGPGSVLGSACGSPISADVYYAPRLWEPAQYWAWQDQLLEQLMQ